MDHILQRARIPVYLLTGHLGSGKTTLLASWLEASELCDSALIINEVGEVGLDQHLLSMATEGVILMANVCVCCTGLPGLADALEDLFWARLQRKIKPFKAVIIETTGLADPRPILQIFKQDGLLKERYRLAGVIVTFSATSGSRTVALHPEAMSQLSAADLVIVTKTDLLPQAELAGLAASVSALNPSAKLATSSKAGFTAGSMLSMLASCPAVGHEPPAAKAGPVDGVTSVPRSNHHHIQEQHSARTVFLALPCALKRHVLAVQLDLWIRKHELHLLRLKGMVSLEDGSIVTVQWVHGDARVDIALFKRVSDSSTTIKMGLTVISDKDFESSVGEALILLLAPSRA